MHKENRPDGKASAACVSLGSEVILLAQITFDLFKALPGCPGLEEWEHRCSMAMLRHEASMSRALDEFFGTEPLPYVLDKGLATMPLIAHLLLRVVATEA